MTEQKEGIAPEDTQPAITPEPASGTAPYSPDTNLIPDKNLVPDTENQDRSLAPFGDATGDHDGVAVVSKDVDQDEKPEDLSDTQIGESVNPGHLTETLPSPPVDTSGIPPEQDKPAKAEGEEESDGVKKEDDKEEDEPKDDNGMTKAEISEAINPNGMHAMSTPQAPEQEGGEKDEEEEEEEEDKPALFQGVFYRSPMHADEERYFPAIVTRIDGEGVALFVMTDTHGFSVRNVKQHDSEFGTYRTSLPFGDDDEDDDDEDDSDEDEDDEESVDDHVPRVSGSENKFVDHSVAN